MPFSIRPLHRLPLAYVSAFWSLIILLLLSSGAVYAEWVSIGETNSGMTIYVDPDTIRRKGDLVKIWILIDYNTIQTTVAGVSYLSSRSQRQFDCAEDRFRMIAFTDFSGNMASGKAIDSYSGEDTWVPVAPGSVNQGLWKAACGKQ